MLCNGKCRTVSSDGLEMILVGDRTDGEKGNWLQVATRKAIVEPFDHPKEIPSLRSQNAWAPSLSTDGLTLYFALRISKGTVYCTREDKESPWSQPKEFNSRGFEESNISLSLITPDGRTLFGQERNQKPRLGMLSRSSTTRPFEDFKRIEVNSHPLFGYWPRYVSSDS